MDTFVIVDIEATGNVNAPNKRIIEIGLVVVEKNDITFQYSTLINPQTPIPPHITNLTGITDKDVTNAPLFSEEAEKLKSIIKDYHIVAHNILFDFRFLNKEFKRIGMDRLTNKIIDTVELSKILFPTLSHYKLGELAKQLNLRHESPHRALSDALVTADLFIELKTKLTRLPYKTKKHLLRLQYAFHSDLTELINQALISSQEQDEYETFNGLTFKNIFKLFPEKNEMPKDSFGYLLDNVFGEDGTLAKVLPQYEIRDGQQKMSELIFDAFQSNQHALIEAATGSGKTLAYLIPAIYESIKNDETIVISTEKVNLQSQLIENELPILQKVLPFPFRYALLKGKTHYLSLERFHEQLEINEDNYNKNMLKAMILVWITETNTGDLNELNVPQGTQFYLNSISTEIEQTKTPWHEWSYYQYAYNKAEHADIVIVNHALLSSDLYVQSKLIPAYKKLIIDEAHHFEDVATKQFSLTIDFQFIYYIVKQLKFKFNTVNRNVYKMLMHDLNELFYFISDFVNRKHQKSVILDPIDRDKNTWLIICEMIDRMINSIQKSLDQIRQSDQAQTNPEVTMLKHSLEDIINNLNQLKNIPKFQDYVLWIEAQTQNGKENIYIYMQHFDITSILSEQLFEKKRSIILTSATLTVENSFTFISKRLGVTERPIKAIINSPFNINEQATLMIPSDFPSINNDEFIYATSETIFSLAHIMNGKMLILFTSHDMLKSVYYLLEETLGLQYNLIAQNITHTNHSDLINEFKAIDRTILLGTNSLWEGIDVPGEALSFLVIVRLPFDNPTDPIFEAKAQMLERTGINNFYHFALPRTIIRLRQGLGRLIRNKNDKGVIFVLDSRIYTATYSQHILSSLPKIPVTFGTTKSLLAQAEQWFRQKNTDT